MDWVEAGSNRPRNLIDGIALFSSASRWRGLSLHSTRVGSGEIPEGQVLSHAVVFFTKGSVVNDRYLPGDGWKRTLASAGVVQFTPALTPYAVRWSGDLEALALEITPAFVAQVCRRETGVEPRLLPLTLTPRNSGLLTQAAFSLRMDALRGSPTGQFYGECLGATIVAELIRHSEGQTEHEVPPSRGLGLRELGLVTEYINDNLDSDLSLVAIASLTDLGADSFARMFKTSMGESPHRYVLRKRLDRGLELLSNTRLSVAEIAAACGFADQSHFNRMFRRFSGLPPLAFRRHIQ
jgi:AraC family transcriptional regulator